MELETDGSWGFKMTRAELQAQADRNSTASTRTEDPGAGCSDLTPSAAPSGWVILDPGSPFA
jgi:hypothetical protein